eukprot:g26840.t1
MVNTRSGPVMYKVRDGVTVLNKHMDHMQAANAQTVWKQNMPSPSEQLVRLLEPVGSPFPSSVDKSSESEIDMMNIAATMSMLPEEESEILLKHCLLGQE